jgi:hypothetical protein
LEKSWRDANRLVSGPGVEVCNLACGAKEAKLSFQPFDFCQCLFPGGAQSDWIGSMQNDLKPCCHRMPGQSEERHKQQQRAINREAREIRETGKMKNGRDAFS